MNNILRLCLKDKSSILVQGNMEDLNLQLTNNQFIKVLNHKVKKEEIYNRDYIWCIRYSSEE